jgi:multicomponent Na+:H+ antiporter subunit F
MFFEIALSIVFLFLSLALILAFYRFLKGPDLTDRVIALDLITMIIAAFIATYMVLTDEPLFMDVIVVAALITFFGTISFARYLEKGVDK